jgi:site-specific recombinase XerD
MLSHSSLPSRHRKSPSNPPRLLEQGCDIRTAQELLGHIDERTTMICSHGLTEGGLAFRRPLDEA